MLARFQRGSLSLRVLSSADMGQHAGYTRLLAKRPLVGQALDEHLQFWTKGPGMAKSIAFTADASPALKISQIVLGGLWLAWLARGLSDDEHLAAQKLYRCSHSVIFIGERRLRSATGVRCRFRKPRCDES